MIQHQGIFLPDGETHLVDWMTRAGEIVDGRGTYQIKKLRAALGYCQRFNVAIDVGAHCGMWSMQLAKRFQWVDAFEPVAAHRECFAANLADRDNVKLHACALGDHDGSVRIDTAPTSSGDSRVGGDGDIPMYRLDDLFRRASRVDFIKLDCEGYEYFALRGGEATIRQWRPVIIVEQKPGRGSGFGLSDLAAVDWLRSLGYLLKAEMAGDYIMVPEDAP
ncbi:MAG: FkbM family methyltransferase [Hyphomicrobiales bacterium]|nr:MAG: FkbM family methyltransferase [Hyphomicrobiales bacterium]